MHLLQNLTVFCKEINAYHRKSLCHNSQIIFSFSQIVSLQYVVKFDIHGPQFYKSFVKEAEIYDVSFISN